ncbi:MAG: protease modulator HflC [Planctomycetes bacterium]|nr:protease modulator HflC [Planctomycetota bacterium]
MLPVGIIAVFTLHGAFYTVAEGDAAVVTRFGRPVRELTEAGPYWKWPGSIDQVHTVSRRRNIFTTPETTSLTRDKKSLVLTTFVMWHVEQPLTFLQSVGDVDAAQTNLAGMVLAAKAQTIGQRDLTALVSINSSDIQFEGIEKAMTAAVAERALSKLGIIVDHVGIERIAFPTENLPAVFERMRVERQGEANRLRAEGQKVAQAIRDEAHVKSQEILREGKEEAAKINAATERRVAERLAEVYQRNPSFFRFWSSLQASKRALKERSTLILSTDQLFFEGLAEPLPEQPQKDSPPALGRSSQRGQP